MSTMGRIPLAGMKPLTLPARARVVLDPDAFAKMKKAADERSRERSPEETAKQIEKQSIVKVHTLYKVDGKIIGVHERNGWTMFLSSGGVRGDADKLALKLGLSGDALNDFLADRMAASLKKKYGVRLQVQHYEDPATAPTYGEVEAAIYGKQTTDGRFSQLV
jgi:hypothetical protein